MLLYPADMYIHVYAINHKAERCTREKKGMDKRLYMYVITADKLGIPLLLLSPFL